MTTKTEAAARDVEMDVAERFKRETADHEMTVLHDDGLYRHIRFRDPKYGSYWFDLITVPGSLIFQCDGETFAFRRVEDMFEFFRSPVGRINSGYWAEKLTTDRDSVMRYDEQLLARYVAEELEEAEKDYPGITDAWNGKTDGILPEYSTYTEDEARAALDDFEFGVIHRASCVCGAEEEFADEYDAIRWRSEHITTENARKTHRSSVERIDGFRFTDTWDWDLKGYHWWFLWALHAIVWGIAQYDAARAKAAA
jgi:hypothetical protein